MNLRSDTDKRIVLPFSNFFLLWFFSTCLLIIIFNSVFNAILPKLESYSAFESFILHVELSIWIPILFLPIFQSIFRF